MPVGVVAAADRDLKTFPCLFAVASWSQGLKTGCRPVAEVEIVEDLSPARGRDRPGLAVVGVGNLGQRDLRLVMAAAAIAVAVAERSYRGQRKDLPFVVAVAECLSQIQRAIRRLVAVAVVVVVAVAVAVDQARQTCFQKLTALPAPQMARHSAVVVARPRMGFRSVVVG